MKGGYDTFSTVFKSGFDLYMVYFKRYNTRALQPTKALTSKKYINKSLMHYLRK